ncbi:MAG: DUF2164 domain-containing protein [Shewanella sp.]|nr:DUF2164 domain-containing protein [Shewanella sp.]MCF1430483.1 DUF2164 domain-containing protein [Shewanella sp.]MCF1439515.1 DUF2164 domain-containing protein [Shewanella sp.]MCF1457756.1 DUF2164 domain-containing protein [Shewanella sp.]
MADIELESSVKKRLVSRLQQYLEDELELDPGEFETEFLLDFVAREAGIYWYNKGLEDARDLMIGKLNDSLDEAAWAIDELMLTESS